MEHRTLLISIIHFFLFLSFYLVKNAHFTVVAVSLSSLSLYIGAIGASKYLHQTLLNTVIRSPMTTFFDVTPIGRIMNRFSNDINEVDNEIPATLRAFTSCFFGVFNLYIKHSFFGCG